MIFSFFSGTGCSKPARLLMDLLVGWLVGSRVVLIKYPQLKDWETTKEQTSVLAA
jgi:hypothetical protein